MTGGGSQCTGQKEMNKKKTHPIFRDTSLAFLDDFLWVRGTFLAKMGSRYVVCEILETTHLAASSSFLWSRTELKTPGGACPVCLSLLPANAPVPSNTDKYCPNPELSLYNRDCIGDFCCE